MVGTHTLWPTHSRRRSASRRLGFARAPGEWTWTGSGVEDWTDDDFSDYSASGNVTGGTYEESGHTHSSGSGHIDDTLDNDGWKSSGTASEGGDGKWHSKSDLTVVTLTSGSASGSSWANSSTQQTKITSDGNWNYGYNEDYVFDAATEKYKWQGTGGSGKGHAELTYDSTASGSGTYTFAFANGQGTASGTTKGDSHSKWGETYDETYVFDTGKQAWNISGSGSGSGDGHGHGEYSASGAYGSSANGGSLSSSGSTDSQWDATWDWNNTGDFAISFPSSGLGTPILEALLRRVPTRLRLLAQHHATDIQQGRSVLLARGAAGGEV